MFQQKKLANSRENTVSISAKHPPKPARMSRTRFSKRRSKSTRRFKKAVWNWTRLIPASRRDRSDRTRSILRTNRKRLKIKTVPVNKKIHSSLIFLIVYSNNWKLLLFKSNQKTKMYHKNGFHTTLHEQYYITYSIFPNYSCPCDDHWF